MSKTLKLNLKHIKVSRDMLYIALYLLCLQFILFNNILQIYSSDLGIVNHIRNYTFSFVMFLLLIICIIITSVILDKNKYNVPRNDIIYFIAKISSLLVIFVFMIVIVYTFAIDKIDIDNMNYLLYCIISLTPLTFIVTNVYALGFSSVYNIDLD